MKEKHFESTVILKPEGGSEAIRQFADRVNGIVEGMNGKIVSFQSWGEKKLAYEIKKSMKGHYVYFDYVGTGALVAELERNFNNWEHVLKFMSARHHDETDPEQLRANAKGVSVLGDRMPEWRPPHEDRPERTERIAAPVAPVEPVIDENREYNAKLQSSLKKSQDVEEENIEL